AGNRQAPGGEEINERFVASLSACLEEIDTAAVAAAAAAVTAGGAVGGTRVGVEGVGGWEGRRLLSAMMSGLVVLVGSAESLESLPASLRRCFTHEVLAPFPSEKLRLSLLEHHLDGVRTGECVTRLALKGLARRLLGRSASEASYRDPM
ncbi:unnamed protein product, partial [Laminaria digitata]